MTEINEYSTGKTIAELLNEWEELINELSEKEIALSEWKEIYQILSDKIIAGTDFKELYGANNQKVRENHVRNELTDQYDIIKDLEFSVNWLHYRIPYLKELIRVKRAIFEMRGEPL